MLGPLSLILGELNMKVTLYALWFAPTELTHPDAVRTFSGRRYEKGVHYFPEEMREFLPSSAKIEAGPAASQTVESVKDWRLEADVDRAALEAEAKLFAEADKKLANRRAGIAKAREAKARKKAEKDEAARKEA